MPRLIVTCAGKTRTVEVGEDSVSVGRTPENAVAVDDIGASRKHAQIIRIARGWELVDLGSRNGTKVNGTPVKRAVLKSGDVIQIGAAEIRFEDGPAGGAPGGDIEVEELDLEGEAAPAAPVAGRGPAGGAPSTAGACVLRVQGGEREGQEIPLTAVRTTFGRKSSNTLSFQDAAVSGVHCEITRESSGFVLRDLGSTNGTMVDGEPVVETVLRHQSRIRIGNQRFLFVDRTVADIESTLSSAEEGEWGMMRGEIDVAAGRRGGAAGVLVAIAVVVAAGAGGAWLVARAPKRQELAEVKDNRIVDASFEMEEARWSSEEGVEASARVVGADEKPVGASGTHSLEVSGPPGGVARVAYRGSMGGSATAEPPVAPGSVHQVSARVDGGRGAVLVTWLSPARTFPPRTVATPVVSGAWATTEAVLVAPPGADRARIELAVFGGGTARFDDVVFRKQEGAAPAESISLAGNLQVRGDRLGRVEALRSGEVMFLDAGFAPGPDAPEDVLLGASATVSAAGGTLALAGTLGGEGGAGFEVSVAAAEGGAEITCAPKGSAPGGFTFTCPGALERGGASLIFERTARVLPESGEAKESGVRKLILAVGGDRAPFVLSAPEGVPGFEFRSVRAPGGLRITLSPADPAAGPDARRVRLAVDLGREDAAADRMLREAAALESDGKLGAAAALYGRAAIEFHYRDAIRKRAEEAGKALLDLGGAELARAQQSLRAGRRFHSGRDLAAAAALGNRLAARFEGHKLGEDAGAVATAAESALGAVTVHEVEQEAERIHDRARDYVQAGQLQLALSLLREVVRICPPGAAVRGMAEKEIPLLEQQLRSRSRAEFEIGAKK